MQVRVALPPKIQAGLRVALPRLRVGSCSETVGEQKLKHTEKAKGRERK